MSGSVLGLLALMLISCTVCQEDICSFRPGSSSVENVTLGIMSSSDWGTEGACHCTVRPMRNDDASFFHLSASLRLLNTDQQDPEDTCQPMVLVSFERGARAASYISEDYFMCPFDGMASKHMSMVGMFPGQEMIIHIDNPQKEALEGMVMLAGAEMSIECSPTDGIIYESCPCRAPNWGAAAPPSEFDAKRRLTIGLVVAFIGLLIIVVIIVGVYFYKRKQAKNVKSKSYNESSAVNPSYEGSKHSVNDPKQPPVRDANVNYAPDPTLNLSLQKGGPGHHGSRDSGLASSNEPSNDRRLPFMQPQATSSSLDNVTHMPENYPPLAGHGSQSSLDHPSHRVEPIYTTRAQPQPQQYAGPRAGNPDFQPPLAGHGSQHSLDQPRFYEGEDVVYAKLNKAPPRSASVERLETGELATRASAESLNASRVTIETDV